VRILYTFLTIFCVHSIFNINKSKKAATRKTNIICLVFANSRWERSSRLMGSRWTPQKADGTVQSFWITSGKFLRGIEKLLGNA
jgi:hypothetical protein